MKPSKIVLSLVILILILGGVYVWLRYPKGTVVRGVISPTFFQNDSQAYENKIEGYTFEYPKSWVEIPSNSERQTEVASCPPNTAGCDYVSFTISVSSVDQPSNYINNLISGSVAKEDGYSQATIRVGGITATELLGKKFGDDRVIYFQRGNEWYVFTCIPGTQNKVQMYAILEKIISTFQFTNPQTVMAPSEYNLLKDIDKWQITYQLSNRSYLGVLMECVDGRQGNVSKSYSFSMYSGGLGDSPGDVDTPYNKVIQVLKDNNWIECSTPVSQQDPTNGISQVFIKNDKLIGVNKRYSMGTGNSLNVMIQYDK